MLKNIIHAAFSNRLSARFFRWALRLSDVVEGLQHFSPSVPSVDPTEALFIAAQRAEKIFARYPRFVLWLCGVRAEAQNLTMIIESYEALCCQIIRKERTLPPAKKFSQDPTMVHTQPQLENLQTKQMQYIARHRAHPKIVGSYQVIKAQLQQASVEHSAFNFHVRVVKFNETKSWRESCDLGDQQRYHQYMHGYFKQLDEKQQLTDTLAQQLQACTYTPPADDLEQYRRYFAK